MRKLVWHQTGCICPFSGLTPQKGTDEIGMCVDMVQLNKVIKEVRHVIPTAQELRINTNDMTVLSKLRLNNGFHQLQLMKKVGNT